MTIFGRIYKITNIESGKSYVGQTTKSLKERFERHFEKNVSTCRAIHNALRKYGKEQFIIEEIAIAYSKDELDSLEIKFIEQFSTLYPIGYNLRTGGSQYRISEESKQRISDSKKGKPNYKRRGIPVSESRKIQISRTLGGRSIKATHKFTGRVVIYETAHATAKDGFNPANVVSVCKGKRPHSKNWIFEYINHANQNGSFEIKNS